MIVVMGDLNAKVGNNNTDGEEVVGKFGVGVMNVTKERGHVTSTTRPGGHQMRGK